MVSRGQINKGQVDVFMKCLRGGESSADNFLGKEKHRLQETKILELDSKALTVKP